MGKRKLTTNEDEVLQKALRVRGASERAVQELWNLFHPNEKHLTRGCFLGKVNQEIQQWIDLMVAHPFNNKDGSEIWLPLVSLRPCLEKLCKEIPAFQNVLRRALSQNNALTPVWYLDEATAGNVLSVDKNRKACLVYMSWLECFHHLKNALCWIPMAVVQTHCLQELEGGSSALVVKLLQNENTDAHARGFALPGGLFFKQRTESFFISDLDASRMVYSLKGSAGTRPCILCKNIVSKGSGINDIDPWFKEISASDGFVFASDAEIFKSADSLTQATPRTKSDLEMMERCTGIRYLPGTLMFDPLQRGKMPPNNMLTDPMHTYFTNGVASWEVALFVAKILEHTDCSLQDIQTAAVSHNWRSLKSSAKTTGYIRALFNDRMFGEGLYKGQAHQTKSILPLLRYYSETLVEPTGLVPDEAIVSFKCLCDVVCFLLKLQHRFTRITAADAQQLQSLQKAHQDAFALAYKDFKPKHHHRFHLSSQMLKIGVLLSCEPHESKHQLYKSGVADKQRGNVKNHAAFSNAVLARLLQSHYHSLTKNGLPFWELLPPIASASLDDKIYFGMPSVQTSKSSSMAFSPAAVCPLVPSNSI